MSFIRIAVLIFIATQAVQGAALQTVPYVDPAQYLGTWYQIARNPLFFERGCVCSRQVLSAEASGQIGIYNTCNDQTPTGRLQEILGTAVNDDPATNARFTVDFGLPNKGQYWIIALDPQYRYAVVSDPSLKSLYILSKTPDLAAGLYDEAVKQAAAQVNTSQLQKTLQMGCNYPAPITLSSLPSAPVLPAHPGSKVYPYGMNIQEIQCKGRAVTVYLPVSTDATEKFPAVVFGHGQALDVSYYSGTLEHLAKRGVAAIFPAYDSGFFDQDWARMGRDYVNVASCALDKFSNQIEKSQTVFAGHSKGAYVASIAAGISVQENLPLRARAVLLFDSAGFDSATISGIEPSTSLTVVYSDHDTIVDRSLSESIYSSAASQHKQFILLKSYPSLQADHFWPLTKASAFGGGAESALHYFGAWKWLVAAAWDLKSGGGFTNPYLYGDLAGDKGVPGFTDDIRRSWTAAPFVDAEVRAYLNSPSTPTFPVLVRYRSVPHPVRAQTRAAQESAMRQQTENQQNSVFHNLAMAAAQNLRPLWLVGGTLAELSAVQILQLLRDPLVESLSWSARPSALNLLPARFSQRTRNRFTYGLEHIGIPQQRANFPQINGAGIRVGYIDTGIDPAHPDLKGKVLAFRDFTTRAPVNASPYDDHGHGSHVAGTIAGGSSSGQAIGVAPGVGLIVAKAFGSYGGTEEGWLLAACNGWRIRTVIQQLPTSRKW